MRLLLVKIVDIIIRWSGGSFRVRLLCLEFRFVDLCSTFIMFIVRNLIPSFQVLLLWSPFVRIFMIPLEISLLISRYPLYPYCIFFVSFTKLSPSWFLLIFFSFFSSITALLQVSKDWFDTISTILEASKRTFLHRWTPEVDLELLQLLW